MSVSKRNLIASTVLFFLLSTLFLTPAILAQDENNDTKVIERYKVMLKRKPREGSSFDRLYQFYLEGDGLTAMVSDYEAEAKANPKDANIQLLLGHIYKRLGNDTDALAAYQRAVELAPNDYYAYFALGQLYVALRKHEEAIPQLSKAATLSDQTMSVTPEELTTIYKALGNAYFNRDRLDDAIEAWNKISELDPQNIFARIELADLYREKELYKQAISQHEAIIEIKADDPYRMCLSLREIGKIHEETGEYKKAQDSYDKALALTARGNWLRRDLQQRIIAIYAADANWTDLITYYQDKLQKDANDTEILGLLAAAYIENEQLEEGIQTYKKGLELSPTDNSLRLSLITALRTAEKLEDAAIEYETITQQQPDNFGIYRELGKIYLELQNEEKARAVYQRMIDRDPTNASTFLTLAEIYTGHEWVEDAATAYQKAISLAPENLDFIEYYGEFYLRQGNSEKAIETWNLMVEADKNTAENYDRLARLLDSKKFKEKAIEASKKAVELMPDTYRFREAYAKRLMDNGKYEEALQEYTQAVKLAPNDFFAEQMDDQRIELYKRNGTIIEKIEEVETQLTEDGITDVDKLIHLKRLAKMYIKTGNSTYALEILLKAKELQPDDININRWTANVYVKQGLRDEAIEIYKHLTTIDAKNAREYYANIANAYLKGFDFEESTEAARQVIAHSPRNPEGHQLLAQIAKQSGKYEQAIDSYKQAIRLRPEIIENRIELAAIYSLAGKYREAVAQYWRCWELSDNINDKLNFIKPLTNAYYDLGRHEELEEKLKQMAKTNTADISPVLALAQVHRTEGDLPSARFQIARALDRQQDNADLLTQLVDISIDLGDIQEALDYQERLVKVKPDPIHRQKLGELLFDVGREQEAIQTWSKVLHAKNQTLEAEVKLANLLIRHGLQEEALSALDSAGEKISGKDAHLALYQLGSTLISMNEPTRAIPHFKRVLAMNKPIDESISNVSAKTTTPIVPQNYYGPPGINLYKLNLASNLQYRIQRQSYGYTTQQTWSPSSFEEAQSGALVQLKVIMEGEGKLDELIQEFENKSQVNPKDIQNLELLAQLYGLIRDNDKSEQAIEKLIAAAPNDPLYQSIQLQRDVFENQLNADGIMQRLDSMQWLTPQTRQWFLADFIRLSSYEHYQGPKNNAEKLLDALSKEAVDDPKIIPMLVNAYISMERAAEAEELITEYIETATPQMLQQFSYTYQTLASIHLKKNEVEKAVAYFWKYFEQTKPKSTNPRRALTLQRSTYSSGGYSPIQSGFPSTTIYYDQNRLRSLQQTFNRMWINDQHEVLYNHLKAEIEKTEGRDRIYPALALCYCYWWENKRDAALEILTGLEQQFSDDLTLKLSTTLVTIQTGKHKEALKLLQDLTQADPRNRRQYFDLTLQIAVNIGDTFAVRDLMTKVLNSPNSVRELYQFSRQLQQAGLTQYAIAVAKKTTTLALRERDPNFLVELSRHLSNLGRGQDAAKIASRALQYASQTDRYGQMMYSYNFQQAANIARRSTTNTHTNRATKLIEAAKNNPNSFQAQIKLATYYESRNQIPQASTAYEAALKLRPKDHSTRTRYIQFLQRNRQYKKAVTHYTILSKQDMNNVQALFSNYYDVVRTYTEAGEIAKLVEITKQTIPNESQHSIGYDFARRVAQRLMSDKKHKYAVEIFEEMMKSSSYTYPVYTELADAYVASGNRDKAIQLLRQKLEIEETTNKIGVIRKAAKFTELTEDLKALSAKYDEMIAAEEVEPVLLYLTAVTKVVTKDFEVSDAIVDRLLKVILTRDRLTWLTTIANTYQEQADVDREIRVLKASLKDADPVRDYQISSVYNQLGTAYAKKGEKDIAKDNIKKMGTIRLMRQSYPAYYEKESVARIYLQHELWDEAEVLLTEVINDLSAQSYYKERAQEQLATLKVRRSGVSGTENTNENNQTTSVYAQRTMAQQHMRRNRIPEAIAAYEQLAKIMPEDLESRSQLASLYSRQNQHDKSIETWKKLLEVDPENTKYMDGIINAYGSAGKFDEAIQLAKKYIEETPEAGTNYSRLARLYSSSNQVEEAITTYKKAIELSPGDGQVYQSLGNLYMQTDKLDDAEKAYNEAKKYLQHSHQHTQIERQMMEIYRRRGKIDEYLKEAEKKGTITFDMQRNLAQNYRNAGKLDEAIKSYEKALQLTTDDWQQRDIERQMLTILRQQGKLEEHLKEAEKKGTLTFSMKVELARQYRRKGESEKAIKTYKEALEMSARSYDFDSIYRELMMEYVRLGEDDSALKLYESMEQSESSGTSITSGPNGFIITFGEDEARQTIITAYKRSGKLDQLRTIFEGRLATNKNDPTNLEMIAELYREAENHEKAAQTYQALTKASPSNVHAYFYAAAAFKKIGNILLADEFINHGNTTLSTSNKAQDMWFLCSIGSICYEAELYEPAIKHLKEALIVTTNRYSGGSRWEQETIYDLLGKSALALKQYEEAVEAFTQLKSIARDSRKKQEAENAIKQAYKDGKLFEKQLPKLIKTVEDNPNDADARLTLAQTYEQNDMFKEAAIHYEKLTEIQPDKVEWHKKVGDLLSSNAIQSNTKENLEKAAKAYEKALSLEPTSYQLFDALAKTYKLMKNQTKAEFVYRQALQTSLEPTEHDEIVKSLLDLYPGETNADKRLALLNELSVQSTNSPFLQRLSGDNYLATGDTEKAAAAYKKWLELLKDDPEPRSKITDIQQLAEKLIKENILPEITLELLKHVVQYRPDHITVPALGAAYLLNEQYDEALAQFSASLNPQQSNGMVGAVGHSHRLKSENIGHILSHISDAGKHVKDRDKYEEMIGKLIDHIPTELGTNVNTNLRFAEFCRELGMHDKAKPYILKTGFLPESDWLTIGPFDNTGGIGYNTAYIPEETTQIDLNAKYEGVSGEVTWQQGTDKVYDGFYTFGDDEKMLTSYAWITFTSPDDRQAQIRFDSDDQGKVWLNGKKVYAHRRTRGAQIDRRTIPVTITTGKNTILVKVSNESLPWGFYLRITDTDGNPYDDLKINKPQ